MIGSGGNLSDDLQRRSQALAQRTNALKEDLGKLRDELSANLRDVLHQAAASSARQRVVGLIVFAVTVVVALLAVNLTIRRSIIGPIRRVIHGVRGAADEVLRASEQVSSSGRLVAQGASEQATYLQQTSASLDQVSSTTRQNAEQAARGDTLMRDTMRVVRQATESMQELIASMSQISQASQQISGVLKSIDEIAFHTNILALNAAVESARAGAAGAGFAVVADEVRALALRSGEAARNTSTLIAETVERVAVGQSLVVRTSEEFKKVAASVDEGADIVSQIAAASTEQSGSIETIHRAVSRMDQVTQSNAANAKESASTAATMNQRATTAQELVNELVCIVGLRQDEELAPV